MESYGFYLAGRYASYPRPEFIMIKGICDNARPPKSDEYQKYAAFLSANFALEFVLAECQVRADFLAGSLRGNGSERFMRASG